MGKWGKEKILTFALEALFPKNTDKGKKLSDFFQVKDCGVIEFNDRHWLLVIRTATAIFL